MNARFRTVALSLILLSFAFSGFVIALVTGLEQTPDYAVDSAGRKMGFNDRLSHEHYVIALSNFRIHNILNPEHFYPLVLLGMQLWGAWLIFSSKANPQRTRRFFLGQGLIFPLGWIGIFVLPWTMRSMFNATMDREGIIDIPFISLTTHPAWIAVAMFVAFSLHKGSVQATHSGSEYAPQEA